MAFGSGAPHLLDTLKGSQLLLHRANQQALPILGADTFQSHGDVDHRDRYVRVGFLGYDLKRCNTPHDQEDKRQ